MRKIWFPMLLVTATVAHAKAGPKPDVIVFFHTGLDLIRVIAPAQAEATRMLRAAGVSVEWRTGKPNYHGAGRSHRDRLGGTARPRCPPRRVGRSHPRRRFRNPDRYLLQPRARRGQQRPHSANLGHVLVHEIAHILEGVSRHSESGVMKAIGISKTSARWRSRPLPFDPEDLRLIRQWSVRHTQITVASAR